ncbi:coenzyme F420-0:L-glutamate ligase [Nocardioides massiliensis]|uniref:Coenzyme F420-0:L-glutamate ligase/coenzyme F420-1:gamma-L-glutamate ligase n=1 Tax=Nocardioides massiliensis TaxID=1325935 RepID=A0ABT9NV56_9ACTN|nr:coenzyme F420-0:L-glutamate ligase [Nocardioides massiliensis]MDP9824191.1 coenzyme F420-0:L-glutamate ligase/coenzyme F420-1:gamma-L-glutamate ligase [Nocardioides massiliensis]
MPLPAPPTRLTAFAPEGVGEVRPGDDLVDLLLTALEANGERLLDDDVVLVTSKVVSKAEDRQRSGGRDEVLADETVRVVARRGPTTIVRTRHGLVMAGAGIDSSNTDAGSVLLLPVAPDASARVLRAALAERTGRRVAVIVTDTAGRAWRHGQTDIAIGMAGLAPYDDHAGLTDAHGNTLAVTAPAVPDELAAVGDLVKGKLSGRPFALVRGLADRVLPVGEDGPGARALVREPDQDLFGFGARDAVRAAATRDDDLVGYGAPLAPEDLPAEATAVVTELLHRLLPGPSEWTVRWVGSGRVRLRVEPGPGPIPDAFVLGQVAGACDAWLRACGWLPQGAPTLVDAGIYNAVELAVAPRVTPGGTPPPA